MEYTEQQRAAIETRARRVCVDAGAGSGKTRILITRILHLIEQRDASLDEIVAITFLENAAAEMKDRLRRAFRQKAPRDDAQAMSFWRAREREVEHARISTIHSFCAAFLREHALHLGLDPEFSMLAEAEAALLRRDAVREALHELLEDGDEQALAIATELGTPQLQDRLHDMIAKRGLLDRVAADWRLDAPKALLKQWRASVRKERERRLCSLHLHPGVQAFLRKLRLLDGRCLKEGEPRETWRQDAMRNLEALGANPPFAEVERILHALAEGHSGRSFKKDWDCEESYEAIKDVQDKIRKFAAACLEEAESDPEKEAHAAAMTCALHATWRYVQDAFDEAKASAAALDFDDLINRTLLALRENEELRERAAKGIKFLLIDEFQDTDGVQLEIARLLSDAPNGPALFIVGDAKQSIYYFRGAEVEVFQAERERAEQVLPLDRNFRTLPDVLEFVNDLFRESGMLAAVGEYHPMAAQRPCTSRQCVEFLASVPPDGDTKHWKAEDYHHHEAALVAARIAEICAPDGGVSICDPRSGQDRAPEFGDVALLFRSMNEIYLYEQALRERGIPYVLISGGGFYHQQEVLDMLNLLRVLLDPWDEPALLAFLRSPMASLSDDALVWLTRKHSLAQAFLRQNAPDELAPEDHVQLREARALVADLRARMIMPLAAFLRHVLDRTGYEAVLLSQFLGVQKAANVRKLVDMADDFSGRRPASLRAFVGHLLEVQHQRAREGEALLQAEGAGAVTLLTIHKSKGLEFPIVFIPQMSKKQNVQPPSLYLHRDLGLAVKTLDEETGGQWEPPMACAIKLRVREEEAAEHARLLYVALTRARDYLVLCGRLDSSEGSWYDVAGDLHGIRDLEDKATFSGGAWRAMLRTRGTAKAVSRERKPPPKSLSREILEVRTAAVQIAAVPRPVISVSALLDRMTGDTDPEEARGDGGTPESASMQEATPGRIAAMARGTLAHTLMERWDFTRDAPPEIPALVAQAGLGLGQQPELIKRLEAVITHFRDTELFPRLRNAPNILREMPFYLPLGECIVSGTIDALLPDGTIIDYKTGKVLAERKARYEWQLRLYAAAVRQLSGIQPTRGIVCYLEAGKEHKVSLGEAEIAETLRLAGEAAARPQQQPAHAAAPA